MRITRMHIVDLKPHMWIAFAGVLFQVTNIIPDPQHMMIRIQADNRSDQEATLDHTIDVTVDAFIYVDVYETV